MVSIRVRPTRKLRLALPPLGTKSQQQGDLACNTVDVLTCVDNIHRDDRFLTTAGLARPNTHIPRPLAIYVSLTVSRSIPFQGRGIVATRNIQPRSSRSTRGNWRRHGPLHEIRSLSPIPSYERRCRGCRSIFHGSPSSFD